MKISFLKISLISTIFSFVFLPISHAQNNHFEVIFENNQQRIYNYSLKPGQNISDQIRIRNYSQNETVEFKIYATDAIKSTNNNFGFKTAQAEQNHLGLWISFGQENYTLKPGQLIDIPFTISVPSYANPENLIGGIILESKNSTNSGNQTILRQSQTIFLDIEGDKKIDYQLFKFEFNSHPQRNFEYSLLNDGSIFLKVIGNIKIKNHLTGSEEIIKLPTQTVLQKNILNQKVPWQTPPLFGIFDAEINLQIENYNLQNNTHQILEKINKKISFNILPFHIISLLISSIIFAISLTLFLIIHHTKIYLNTKNYQVLKNETLEDIATKLKINWKTIAKLNKLKAPFNLISGQNLKIPRNNKSTKNAKKSQK